MEFLHWIRSGLTVDHLWDVITSLLAGFISAYTVARWSGIRRWGKSLKQFGHLLDYLEGRSEIVIYIPRLIAYTINKRDAGPRNILFGPVEDAKAATELALILRKVSKDLQVKLRAAPEGNFQPSEEPFISIGGPYYNSVTRYLVQNHIGDHFKWSPKVEIHGIEVSIADHPGPAPIGGRFIDEDVGFILTGKTTRDTPFIAAWGVYAFGTAVATHALLGKLKKADKDGLKDHRNLPLLAWHAPVIDYDVDLAKVKRLYRYRRVEFKP